MTTIVRNMLEYIDPIVRVETKIRAEIHFIILDD